ncbi:MAG: hypothetical protein AB7F96_22250 [Beijerinckiaceae bacterium]
MDDLKIAKQRIEHLSAGLPATAANTYHIEATEDGLRVALLESFSNDLMMPRAAFLLPWHMARDLAKSIGELDAEVASVSE